MLLWATAGRRSLLAVLNNLGAFITRVKGDVRVSGLETNLTEVFLGMCPWASCIPSMLLSPGVSYGSFSWLVGRQIKYLCCVLFCA